jgi:AmiR/NasT family two-component response regulator
VVREAPDPTQAAEDLQAIERAKVELMNCLGMAEPEALRRLQALASGHGRKLAEEARDILRPA